ncbi:MAG: hypothetical protein JNK53_01890 [Phycisphaerae bacterium]|nr:hypothetical protein [Phycisphaerae bacterium]
MEPNPHEPPGACPRCHYRLPHGWSTETTRCTECGVDLPPGADAHAMLVADPARSAAVARAARWLCLAAAISVSAGVASTALHAFMLLDGFSLEWDRQLTLDDSLLRAALDCSSTADLVLSWCWCAALATSLFILARVLWRESRVRTSVAVFALAGCTLLPIAETGTGIVYVLTHSEPLHSIMTASREAIYRVAGGEAIYAGLAFALPVAALPLGMIVLAALPLGRRTDRTLRIAAALVLAGSLLAWLPYLAWWLSIAAISSAGWDEAVFWSGFVVSLGSLTVLALVARRAAIEFAGSHRSRHEGAADARLWLIPGGMAMLALLAWASPPMPAIQEWVDPATGVRSGFFVPSLGLHARTVVSTCLAIAWLVPWALLPTRRIWVWWLAGSILATLVAAASVLARS